MPKATTKTAPKKTANLKTKKQRKLMIIVAVLVFAIAGGALVYRSQAAARHVRTYVATDWLTLNKSAWGNNASNYSRKTVRASGKSGTAAVAWVKKNATYAVESPVNLTGAWYKACFEVYNSRGNNTVAFSASKPAGDASGNLAGTYALIRASNITVGPANRLQTKCLSFTGTSGTNVSLRLSITPKSNNIMLRKVTLIKQ